MCKVVTTAKFLFLYTSLPLSSPPSKTTALHFLQSLFKHSQMPSPLSRSSSSATLAPAPTRGPSGMSLQSSTSHSSPRPDPPAASLEERLARLTESPAIHGLAIRCCMCRHRFELPVEKCPICDHREPCEICLGGRHVPEHSFNAGDHEDLLASPEINGRAMSSSSGGIWSNTLVDGNGSSDYQDTGYGLVGIARPYERGPGCGRSSRDDGPIQDHVCCGCGKPLNGEPCENYAHYRSGICAPLCL